MLEHLVLLWKGEKNYVLLLRLIFNQDGTSKIGIRNFVGVIIIVTIIITHQ